MVPMNELINLIGTPITLIETYVSGSTIHELVNQGSHNNNSSATGRLCHLIEFEDCAHFCKSRCV